MTSSPPELVLYGVFRALLTHRVPVSVPDYLDAIRALQSDFGLPPLGRKRLRWLTKTLWARTDDERRLIDSVFSAIPLPTGEEIDEGERTLGLRGQRSSDEAEEPPDKGTAATGPRVMVEFRSPKESDGLPLPRLAPKNETAPEAYVMRPQTVVNVSRST
jgi:hypothetical protein